jgi:predicted nucleic acid-binding protein
VSVLLDSSVVVAAIAEDHPSHRVAVAAYNACDAMIIYDHSLLEIYRVLTFPNLLRGGFGFMPDVAIDGLKEIITKTVLISLTAEQRFDALQIYARSNVISSRIYDAMIGHAGILHGATAIMTLNARNFRSLFPTFNIIDPSTEAEV